MEKGKGYHMISAYLDEETYNLGKATHITWSHLIRLGIMNSTLQQKFNLMALKYAELEEKQKRTAQLLGKYAAGDTDVLE